MLSLGSLKAKTSEDAGQAELTQIRAICRTADRLKLAIYHYAAKALLTISSTLLATLTR